MSGCPESENCTVKDQKNRDFYKYKKTLTAVFRDIQRLLFNFILFNYFVSLYCFALLFCLIALFDCFV